LDENAEEMDTTFTTVAADPIARASRPADTRVRPSKLTKEAARVSTHEPQLDPHEEKQADVELIIETMSTVTESTKA